MADNPEQFDGLLMTCLQQGGGITNFFDSIFGFLERKSDFFANEKQSKSYVDVHYNKWLRRYEEKKEREKKIRERKEAEEKAKLNPTQNSTATVKEITPEEFERRQKEEEMKKKIAEAEKNKPAEKKEDDKKEDDGDKLQEGHVMPNKEKGYNLEKYSWAQMDIKEITITFYVDSKIRGRDLDIHCDNTHFFAGIKGQTPIIDSELHAAIKSDTMIWTLEEVKDKKLVTITFEKANPTWWECVEKDDKTLVDTRKIQPEPSKIADIEDPELKAQVEKMMFDTRQKAMGKPTSDILQKAPQLEEFMRKHPEMDFSKAKFG